MLKELKLHAHITTLYLEEFITQGRVKNYAYPQYLNFYFSCKKFSFKYRFYMVLRALLPEHLQSLFFHLSEKCRFTLDLIGLQDFNFVPSINLLKPSGELLHLFSLTEYSFIELKILPLHVRYMFRPVLRPSSKHVSTKTLQGRCNKNLKGRFFTFDIFL